MLASAVLLMLIPVAGGWAVSFAGSASLRSPALHRGFAAGGATQGSRASVLRGKNARWVAQMNPVEKLASELGDVMAGVTGSTSKSFHPFRTANRAACAGGLGWLGVGRSNVRRGAGAHASEGPASCA